MQKRVPIGKIVRLVAKAARYSKGGFSAEERRDLGVSLLELASAILEDDEKQEHLPYALDRPDAVR